MRNAAFLAFALVLALLQGSAHRVVGPLGLTGWTPSLLLPLVIFIGVHEPSMPRGAFLAFVMGHALDLFASAPIGLFTFVYVATWWLARIVGVRLASQTVPTQIALSFAFALVQSLIVLVLLVVFGADPLRPVELSVIVMPHATSTAICAPMVFRVAERLQQTAQVGGRGTEATPA